MATEIGKTSSTTGTVAPHASAASGDLLVASAWSDAVGTAITAPDGTWTEVQQGQDAGPANRLTMFYKVLTGAPAANYTFAGPTIGGVTMVCVRPGAGESLTSVVSSIVNSTAAGSGALTSGAIDTTPTPNAVVGTWCADDASTVTSAPATLAAGEVPAVSSGGLATYSALDINDAAFTDSLTWSTAGTERICIVAAFKFTVSASSTQPPRTYHQHRLRRL